MKVFFENLLPHKIAETRVTDDRIILHSEVRTTSMLMLLMVGNYKVQTFGWFLVVWKFYENIDYMF
jgi:hypothetical protein